jgi:hypothetical protein
MSATSNLNNYFLIFQQAAEYLMRAIYSTETRQVEELPDIAQYLQPQ